MAKKRPSFPEQAPEQQQIEEGMKKAELAAPRGRSPEELTIRSNMKRQSKKMHQQDNKR